MQIKNLSMSFGMQELFTEINLYIGENEKIGIVGDNGAGKSTFFKILLGKLEPTGGKIILDKSERIGFLPQTIQEEIFDNDITVLDFLLTGRPIDKLNSKLQNLYNKLANTKEDKLPTIYKQISNIQTKLDYWDAYNAENILLKIINGMKIDDSLLNQKVNDISGGQKSKVAFAKLLYSNPEVLLLDEPTNHLDESTKEYVTKFIQNYKGSVFVISHDEDFLDSIATKILFIDKQRKTFELYDGNYSKFKKIHSERIIAITKQAEIQQREEDKLKAIIDKYSNSSGKRKKMAQDREKKLEKLMKDKIELGPKHKDVKLEININRESNNIPVKVENLSFKYDKNQNKNIIDNLNFELLKGEKFLIVGENGVGKSTLLKLLVGELKPDSGTIMIGNKTDIGYYAQEHELLNENESILENFSDINIPLKQLRNVLGRFLFYGDDVNKKISVLSPGERSRVALAKLSLTGANLLILDEPTNHLDPQTQKIIAETFKDYKGTMLVVSHNPEFANNLGIERTLILPSGKISYYQKSIVEYFQNINTSKK